MQQSAKLTSWLRTFKSGSIEAFFLETIQDKEDIGSFEATNWLILALGVPEKKRENTHSLRPSVLTAFVNKKGERTSDGNKGDYWLTTIMVCRDLFVSEE